MRHIHIYEDPCLFKRKYQRIVFHDVVSILKSITLASINYTVSYKGISHLYS